MKFPVDAPRGRVVRALHHPTLKSSTLRAICTQAGIPRDEFLHAYDRS